MCVRPCTGDTEVDTNHELRVNSILEEAAKELQIDMLTARMRALLGDVRAQK